MDKNKSKVINLGCRLNFFESEIIKNILDKNDIKKKIVINTCAVTNQAVKKSINEVKKASKDFPDYKIIVTGCASHIDKDLFSNLKNVTKIINNHKKTDSSNYTNDRKSEIDSVSFPYLSNFSSDRSRGTLQIQQGCDHRCTFCIIPFGRGDSKSLEFKYILERTKKLIAKGYNEIILTGVDLTSYGHDLKGKPRLGNVLKRLLACVPNLKRLRLSSIDPAEIDQDLMEIILNEERLLPHLHLSIQSGDNLILKRMKRRHDRETVINLCKKINSIRTEFTFGADIIVGFPTETDENFYNTVNLLKVCNFTNIHIFPFSPKKGTPASRMPQVKEEIKKQRVQILRKESQKLLHRNLNKKIGKLSTILFESNKKSYTNEYLKVKFNDHSNNNLSAGSIANVKIISRHEDFLIAESLK